jgi:hypothetical protein
MAVGCERSPAPSASGKEPVNEPVARCDAAHAKVLEQELLAQCAISEQVLSADVPAAPWSPAPSTPPDDALRIELGPAGMTLGHRPPVPVAALSAALAEQREQATARAELSGRPAPAGWLLTLDGTTPRADVATILRDLSDAGLLAGHLQLATEPTGPLPMPRNPEQLAGLARRIPRHDASTKATFLAQEIEQAMPPCPALYQSFSTAAMLEPESRCSVLARGIAEGLVSCGCPQEDAMMTWMYAITVGLEPPRRLGVAVPVTLDPAAAPRAGATWAEVVAGLDEAALATLWVSAG